MINLLNIIFIALVVIGSIIAIVIALSYLLKKDMFRRHTLQNHIDIVELFSALEFIIKVEIELYESYLKNNTNTDVTSITNTEFINIYKDLSMKCLEAPSPQFWELVEVYMNRESVQTYITQRVYGYLADKVKE